MVRLACTKCDRRRQYRQSTPIERYAPDKNVETFRGQNLAGGPPEDRPPTRSWTCAASTIPTGSAESPRANKPIDEMTERELAQEMGQQAGEQLARSRAARSPDFCSV
jgi:hypothetical protein